MKEPSNCPVCGAPLVQGRGGICPACLLQAALGDDHTLPQATGEGGAEQSPPAWSEQPGTRIGHYKLLERIGEGGFGVVWMAEQEEPVRRRVALKIIKLGMDTREVVARFEAERQALAMMEHPNIASVFDGGATDTGRPYFVMELVKGVPITTYCDANQLTTRERLELFMEVCHAVQHAHQKGVIHRDLADQPARRASLQATLGQTYKSLGLCRRAIPLLEEVLEHFSANSGPEHPVTLWAMTNLANSFYTAGHLDEAIKLRMEVLTLSLKMRGPEHPDTLRVMTNLTTSYFDAGSRNEALKMQEVVLPLSRKVLGPEHPDTLTAINSLANSSSDVGRKDEAIKMSEEVLELCRKVIGPKHPDTLMAIDYLAISYFDAGRIQESAAIISEHAEFLCRAKNGPHGELQAQLHQRLVKVAEALCQGPVEEDAIKRYYAGNKESFRETSVHLFTITVPLEVAEEARAEQRKEVEALRDGISNGKPFAEVAQEHSQDPYASDGGDNGTVKRRDRAEPLDSAIFALKPGVLEIHDDGRFLRILKVEDRVDGEIAPLEDLREVIAGIILQRQRDELLQQWQEAARVKVDAWEKENNGTGGPERAAGEKEIQKAQGNRYSNQCEP